MPPEELSGPDLDGVVADANAVELPYVVIGGFAVIAHGYLRATKDSDLLVPDGVEADEAVLRFLDRIEARRLSDDKVLTETVAGGAVQLDAGGEQAPFASLRTIVGFKRLADRGRTVSTSKTWSASTASCRSTRYPASIRRHAAQSDSRLRRMKSAKRGAVNSTRPWSGP
jgi:hypothetical protein